MDQKKLIFESPGVEIYISKEKYGWYFYLHYKEGTRPSIKEPSFGVLLAKAGYDVGEAIKMFRTVFENSDGMEDFYRFKSEAI